jgi:hypothetical protein
MPLWAFAKMGLTPGQRVMGMLAGRVEEMAGTFNAQEVAMTLGASATWVMQPGAREMEGLEDREG